MNKILITAFQPFGLTGKFVRMANASADIADILQSSRHADCDVLILPVSPQADTLLRMYLEEHKPGGILCMGENLMLPDAVTLEPFAYDTAPTFNMLAAAYSSKIKSPFLADDISAPQASGIGTYYCNSLYKTALLWAAENNNVPTAFAHISVVGNRERQSEKIVSLLDRMKQKISYGAAPSCSPQKTTL